MVCGKPNKKSEAVKKKELGSTKEVGSENKGFKPGKKKVKK